MITGGSNAEARRLEQEAQREANWKRWGPYLSERQWGTVREDYSPNGKCWEYFPHDHARSRAYRWGEDGLLGITDRECRLCFAVAMWNGRDPILKERLFGLSNREGNHGEDVKELYFYLDNTPTHSYMKGLYKYPQAEYPYLQLVQENARRSRQELEYEITDTGIFDDNRYFDVFAEYAKNSPNDILIRITVANRGPKAATIHLLPTLWFHNSWSWGCVHEGCWPKPWLRRRGQMSVEGHHATLGRVQFDIDPAGDPAPILLFTENETNKQRLYGVSNDSPYVKDAFHQYVIQGQIEAVNPEEEGTKVAAYYLLELPPRSQRTIRLRLGVEEEIAQAPFGEEFDRIFAARIREADEFYMPHIPADLVPAEKQVMRQAFAGLLWSRQYYHYVVEDWLNGDPLQPPPPPQRWQGRNHDWMHLFNRDVISMPDKWEYPWYAAWDLAFHMIPMASIDPAFAKQQLLMFLREWYMHPSGELPAYEFALGDVNPPVHAWACWRVYKMTGRKGQRDHDFLARAFQKLLLNFTWWVNRKDVTGKHIFSGGFLGLDNIAIFDRSQILPNGRRLDQADATAWMAFYCATMLSMALELATVDSTYEDIASKFFEHFVAIADAINTLGGSGLWNDQDGFYYDQLQVDSQPVPLRVRSVVGLIPLLAVEVLDQRIIDQLPGFKKRMQWFLEYRKDLAKHITYLEHCRLAPHVTPGPKGLYLLAIPSRQKLERVLKYLLDESEFLSPYGIRSLSAYHREHPYTVQLDGSRYCVRYTPGESDSALFGGNSNWRGPIWFPINYLIIEALERYHHFYGDGLKVEYPTGSGRSLNLCEVASELAGRLCRLFLPEPVGLRPCNGQDLRFATDPYFKDLVLFYECFHGDTGRGLGSSHQTGWTALITRLLEMTAQGRLPAPAARRAVEPIGAR
ncbi:MAG: MGH1-like glycoside hydrolase domain-containing protein [Bacillota bacterium]